MSISIELNLRSTLDSATPPLTMLAVLRGPDGPEGKSAYQGAVDRGFVGSYDAWLGSLASAANALATTQAAIATAKAAAASTDAGTATTQAGIATTQAGIATTRAAESSTSASTATTQAGVATTGATTATTQAGIATTKASQSTTDAAAALASAATASTKTNEAIASATAAAAQATLANSNAGIAATQAGIAVTASNSATAANTAANASFIAARDHAISAAGAAAQTASDRAQTAINRTSTGEDRTQVAANRVAADSSAVSAIAAASQASGHKNTATASAAAAFDSAASATTSATAASGSAASASTFSSQATTRASEALASAQTATIQASASTSASNTATVKAAEAVTSASQANTSATAANTSAGAAGASSAQALAIFGNSAAVNSALQTAAAQSSAAQTAAASASSVLQQDLSAISATLHRSPAAVTAMTIYDTSKDSDGGAWVDRMQDKSWANEPLNGAWLTGGFVSEADARAFAGSSASPELVVNGTFDANTAGWIVPAASASVGGAILTWIAGIARLTNDATGTNFGTAYRLITCVVGRTYRVSMTIASGTGAGFVGVGTTGIGTGFNNVVANRNTTFTFVATQTSHSIGIQLSTAGANLNADFDNISFKEVDAAIDVTGRYYQLTTDGKFYRLWKNIIRASADLDSTTGWGRNSVAITANATAAADGTVTAEKIIPTAVASVHAIEQSATFAIPAGTKYSVTCEVKAAELSRLRFWHPNTGVGNRFNAFTGLFETTNSGDTNTVTNLGSGWYRITSTYTQPTSVAALFRFYITDAAGVDSWTGDGTSGIFITKVQVEIGDPTVHEAKAIGDASTTEVFRGNKAKFPRLAAIVAEGGNVTIYDLTEPGRPMWMRSAVNGSAQGTTVLNWSSAGQTITAVCCSQGKLILGAPQGGEVLDFAADEMRFMFTGLAYRPTKNRIADRQSIGGVILGGPTYTILNSGINAIAITVLPDAPIDVVTGLPVPTIAVMTAGGVSVIRQDGTVASHAFTTVSIDAVAFSGVRLLYGSAVLSFGLRFIRVADITGSSFVGVPMHSVATNIGSNNLAPSRTEGLVAVRQFSGLGRLIQFRLNYVSQSLSLRADIADTFNTGWMIGDVRRAYMADTVVESITAPELVTNGTFNVDTAGWTTSTAYASTSAVVNGTMQVTSTATFGRQMLTVNLVVGKLYRFSGSVALVSGAGTSRLHIGTSNVGGDSGSFLVINNNTTTMLSGSILFVATAAIMYVAAGSEGTTGTTAFDNITIKEVSPDRSYKAAAANINGTIVKSAVASAAQLVTFSGWNALNYLQEPYSADLDYGVGDFRLSAWIRYTATRVNLLTKSEQFDDVAWVKSVGASITPNHGPAPDGTMTAARVILPAAGEVRQAKASFGVNTINSWVKGVTGETLAFLINSIGAPPLFTFTGAWQQIVRTDAVNPAEFIVYGTYSGATAKDFQIWHPQLETGSTTTSYQRVNTATDYDGYNATIAERSAASGPSFRLGIQGDRLIATVFDGTTTRTVTSTDSYATGVVAKASMNYSSGRLAINVNGAEVASTNGAPLLTMNSASPRHNLLTKSEQFNDAAYDQVSFAVATPNAVMSPIGDLTADTLTTRAVAFGGVVRLAAGFAYAANTTYTMSVYAKKGTHNRIGIRPGGKAVSVGDGFASFDLTTGAFTTIVPIAGVIVSGVAVNVGNDWWRCAVTYTTDSTPTATTDFGLVNASNTVNYTPAGTENLFLWGAQLDLGPTATTYQRVNTVADYDLTVAIRASLTIGNSRTLDAPFPGSIAFVKTGVTIPTPEQAQWMFDQERRMFQSGARITLPASAAVSDLAYDDQLDRWVAIQPAHESNFTGLVRTAVTAPSAGAFSKVSAVNGAELISRITTSPGVDVTIPPYGLREELVRRAEAAAKANRPIAPLNRDAIGFTATTTSAGSALTAVSVTSGVPYIGMVVSGAGIPAGTRIIGINGTIYYLSANATATGTAVAIGQTSFILPVGFTAIEVMTAGNSRQEGSTKDYTRTFDGFAETVQFAVSPGSGAWCQFIIRKEVA